MNATAEILIRDLADCGVRLSRNADRLRVEGPKGSITPELKLVLSERKAELLAVLSGDSIRDHLLSLAAAEGIDAEMVRALRDCDVAECVGLDDAALSAYVRMLRDADLRERGRCPPDETSRALCRSCGPIFLHPAITAVAPVLDTWPRVLGCPWCHVKNRRAIPRPSVTCADCSNFQSDVINPAGGVGHCGKGMTSNPLHYPHAPRQCHAFKPGRASDEETP